MIKEPVVVYDNEEYNKKIKENKILQRIFSDCKLNEETECIISLKCNSSNEYGFINNRGKTVRVHKYAYEQLVGRVLDGFELDHICRNRKCCNVYHLEQVTHQVNVLRGISPTAINARKTHCIYGHPFSGSNLYIYANGGRRCKTCNKNNTDKYRGVGIYGN